MTIGEMRVINRDGDTKIVWDSNNPDEVANAKRTFDDLKQKRYVAYSVTKKGDKDEIIREFDPNAEKLIMAPPMAGG